MTKLLAIEITTPAKAEAYLSAVRTVEKWVPAFAGDGDFDGNFAMSVEAVLELPPDPSLADELAREDMVEMANLTSAQTGISGTIFISAAMGAHGPRVKYFLQPGRAQPSFAVSIGDAPAVVANLLSPRTLRQMAPQVIDWVLQNRHALLDFWNNGDTWAQPQVNDFIQKLRRV